MNREGMELSMHTSRFVNSLPNINEITLSCGRCYISQTGCCVNGHLREHSSLMAPSVVTWQCIPSNFFFKCWMLRQYRDQGAWETCKAMCIKEKKKKRTSLLIKDTVTLLHVGDDIHLVALEIPVEKTKTALVLPPVQYLALLPCFKASLKKRTKFTLSPICMATSHGAQVTAACEIGTQASATMCR